MSGDCKIAFKRLERYAVKAARTVLRGANFSNGVGLLDNKLIGSMSRKGNCWDNSIAESFFHTLKIELVHANCYMTRKEAKQSIFQYLEGYYNRIRMHSAIDYKAPIDVECAA